MKGRYALLSLAALGTAPAMAAERGFYVGADAGEVSYGLDRGDTEQRFDDAFSAAGLTVVDASSSTSEDGFTYSITVGYQFLPYLAVEAAWVDLDNAESDLKRLAKTASAAFDKPIKLDTGSLGALNSSLGDLEQTWQKTLDVTRRINDATRDIAASTKNVASAAMGGAFALITGPIALLTGFSAVPWSST